MSERNRATAVHYGGRLRIVHKGITTSISAGGAACGTGRPHFDNVSFVLDQLQVTCKRCRRLIEMHRRTAGIIP